MGKKYDKRLKRDQSRLRMYGPSKEQRKFAERYGIDPDDYHVYADMSDRVHGKKSMEDFERDITKAAGSDYHTGRAIEAAALAGDEKAQKFAKKGIANILDLKRVQRMQEDQHKERTGGAFASPSDFAGLSFDMVEKDRKKLMDDLQAKTEVATPELPEPPPEPQFLITQEEDLARDTERDERIAEYERNRALTGLIGDEDTQKYLDDYKFNVASGLSNADISTRGPEAPLFIL